MVPKPAVKKNLGVSQGQLVTGIYRLPQTISAQPDAFGRIGSDQRFHQVLTCGLKLNMSRVVKGQIKHLPLFALVEESSDSVTSQFLHQGVRRRPFGKQACGQRQPATDVVFHLGGDRVRNLLPKVQNVTRHA